ncbi:NepR family anti-sigma factor [Gymnodinialimonas ulvae]|uniref:NepR family anti-sigma factor n=1 Tax=Gymnodinialimonas ulvae TaxID=3126504 RepID=UPI0030A9AAA0
MDQKPKKSSTRPKAIDRQIDENLRRVYDETLNEALPDRFTDLLTQLKSGKKVASNDK